MTGFRSLLRVALTLLLAGACAVGAAQGIGRGQGGPPAGAGTGSPPPDAGPPGGSGHVLYAALRFASEGTLVIDGGRVEAPPPWPRYLAPGMWLRALGDWDGDVFRASELVVSRPASFSYYFGPAAALDLGEGWIEAWFASPAPGEGVSPFALRRVAPGPGTEALLRSSAGAWVALPPGLRPPPPPPVDGWALLRGEARAGAVLWRTMAPFP